MPQPFEDVSALGKDFVDTSLKSLAALSRSAQAIATEASEYSKKSVEAGAATVEKLFAVKSLEKAIELQSDYARTSYEAFVAQATKMGELYADMAKEAYRPYESLVARAR